MRGRVKRQRGDTESPLSDCSPAFPSDSSYGLGSCLHECLYESNLPPSCSESTSHLYSPLVHYFESIHVTSWCWIPVAWHKGRVYFCLLLSQHLALSNLNKYLLDEQILSGQIRARSWRSLDYVLKCTPPSLLEMAPSVREDFPFAAARQTALGSSVSLGVLENGM